MSVQVHPDDEYGLKNENDLGKTESWYIIDADKDSSLVYGHNAKSLDELKSQINSSNWDSYSKL